MEYWKIYDRLKFLYRSFWALFIFSILALVISLVRLAFAVISLVIYPQEISALALLSAILPVLAYFFYFRTLSCFIFNTGSMRAISFARFLTLFQSCSVALLILQYLPALYMPVSFLSAIIVIDFISAVLLLLFTCDLLFKVLGKKRIFKKAFKLFFAVDMILICFCFFISNLFSTPDIPTLIFNIIGLLLRFLLYFTLYKALTNDWFYRRFIVLHPNRFFTSSPLRPSVGQ